jgi:hypothetical protein
MRKPQTPKQITRRCKAGFVVSKESGSLRNHQLGFTKLFVETNFQPIGIQEHTFMRGEKRGAS